MATEFNADADFWDWGLFNQTNGAAKLVVSFWYRPKLAASKVSAHAIGQLSSSTVGNWGIRRDGSSPDQLRWEFGNFGSPRSVMPSGVLVTGIWSHIHYVYDGTQVTNALKLRCWVDKLELEMVEFGGFPSSLDSTSEVLKHGQDSPWVDGLWGDYGELNIWVGVAITGARQISKIYNGCASLVFPSFLEFDVGYLADPPVDRSKNGKTATKGATPTVVAHPPDVGARVTCGACFRNRERPMRRTADGYQWL